jgi:ABC-type microcin C transport system permease subunit YejE
MNDFIFKHWSGEYSLARAYCVNGVLIGFLAYMIAVAAGAGLEELGVDRESILPVIYFFLIVLNVWQTVGIFRSALRDGGYFAQVAIISLAFDWMRMIGVIRSTFH